MAKGLTEQFTATGTYTDGSTANLTTQVTWVSATTSVATISNTTGSQGLASTLATGTTQITAALSGITSPSDTLTVTAAALASIAVAPVNPIGRQGAHRAIHGDGDLHRRLDREPDHPGRLGVGDDVGRDDLQHHRQSGPGLHPGHRHDRDHRGAERDHEPERHADGDCGGPGVDRSGPGESVGCQGAHRAVHGDGDLHRRHDRQPHEPGDLGVGDAVGRDDQHVGPGVDSGGGNDQHHGVAGRNNEPGGHPDGDRRRH